MMVTSQIERVRMLNAGKALCRSGVGRITLADLYAMTLIRISESSIGSCDDRKERNNERYAETFRHIVLLKSKSAHGGMLQAACPAIPSHVFRSRRRVRCTAVAEVLDGSRSRGI